METHAQYLEGKNIGAIFTLQLQFYLDEKDLVTNPFQWDGIKSIDKKKRVDVFEICKTLLMYLEWNCGGTYESNGQIVEGGWQRVEKYITWKGENYYLNHTFHQLLQKYVKTFIITFVK